jgi:hypothetical protein
MEADRILVGGRAEKERHWISKEEYLGNVTFCADILSLKIKPIPPPPPCGRGQWEILKEGGRSELMVAGRVSGWSQVSVRQRMSILLSRIRCLRISGLLYRWVIEEADLILNVASFKVGKTAGTGPGFISTSPAKSKRQKVSKEEVLY